MYKERPQLGNGASGWRRIGRYLWRHERLHDATEGDLDLSGKLPVLIPIAAQESHSLLRLLLSISSEQIAWLTPISLLRFSPSRYAYTHIYPPVRIRSLRYTVLLLLFLRSSRSELENLTDCTRQMPKMPSYIWKLLWFAIFQINLDFKWSNLSKRKNK